MGITLLDEPILYVCDECSSIYSDPSTDFEGEEQCPFCLSVSGHRERKEITDTDIAELLDGDNYWKIREAIKNVHKKKGDNN